MTRIVLTALIVALVATGTTRPAGGSSVVRAVRVEQVA